eukprot:3369073-Rhodomonas_salina.1
MTVEEFRPFSATEAAREEGRSQRERSESASLLDMLRLGTWEQSEISLYDCCIIMTAVTSRYRASSY